MTAKRKLFAATFIAIILISFTLSNFKAIIVVPESIPASSKMKSTKRVTPIIDKFDYFDVEKLPTVHGIDSAMLDDERFNFFNGKPGGGKTTGAIASAQLNDLECIIALPEHSNVTGAIRDTNKYILSKGGLVSDFIEIPARETLCNEPKKLKKLPGVLIPYHCAQCKQHCRYKALLHEVMSRVEKSEPVRIACTHDFVNTPYTRAIVEKMMYPILIFDEQIGYTIMLKQVDKWYNQFSDLVEFIDNHKFHISKKIHLKYISLIREMLHVLLEHNVKNITAFFSSNAKRFTKTCKEFIFNEFLVAFNKFKAKPKVKPRGFSHISYIDVLFDIAELCRKFGEDSIKDCFSFKRGKVFVGIKNQDFLTTMKTARKLIFLDATQNSELLAAFLGERIESKCLVIDNKYPVYQLDLKKYGMKYLSDNPSELNNLLALLLKIVKFHAFDKILIVSRVSMEIQKIISEFLSSNGIEHEIVQSARERREREKEGHLFSKRVVLDHWPLKSTNLYGDFRVVISFGAPFQSDEQISTLAKLIGVKHSVLAKDASALVYQSNSRIARKKGVEPEAIYVFSSVELPYYSWIVPIDYEFDPAHPPMMSTDTSKKILSHIKEHKMIRCDTKYVEKNSILIEAMIKDGFLDMQKHADRNYYLTVTSRGLPHMES